MLTDLYAIIPPRIMRWLLKHVARLDLDAVCDWLCDAGLCPCGVDLDARARELAAAA